MVIEDVAWQKKKHQTSRQLSVSREQLVKPWALSMMRRCTGVDIDIVAVLGTAELKVSQILQLGRGAVVELDRLPGEPVDIRAERELVARGEVVVVEDKLAIQLSEVIRNTGSD